MSLILSIEYFPLLQHQVVDNEKKISHTLIRDDHFTYRCAHWTDLHSIIHKALPSDIIFWGHRFLSLCISDDKGYVKIKVEVSQTSETKEMVADLLIAADGSLSTIRQHFLPDHKMRLVCDNSTVSFCDDRVWFSSLVCIGVLMCIISSIWIQVELHIRVNMYMNMATHICLKMYPCTELLSTCSCTHIVWEGRLLRCTCVVNLSKCTTTKYSNFLFMHLVSSAAL